MADSTDSASYFWARFLELSEAGPADLLRLVCNHLTRNQRQALRGVDRAMRRAVNAAMTCVTCGEEAPPTQDLPSVFPSASSLDLHLTSDAACALLEQLASNNARLLANLRHLSADMCVTMVEGPAFIAAMLELFRR
jgi:hypothetical protein